MTATALVPVFTSTIQNQPAQLCNARDLHAFLDVGRDFATWIKDRIAEYGFSENDDYFLIDSPKRGNQKSRGGDRRSKDYHLTLDMAKELAMVERNEKGRQVRRYFIECERRALAAVPPAPTLPKSGLGRSLREEIRQAVAEAVGAELPKLTAPLYSLKNVWAHLSAGNGMYIDSDTLAEIASDCNAKLASRAAFYQQRALAARH
jgi:phage anti-repressor protein